MYAKSYDLGIVAALSTGAIILSLAGLMAPWVNIFFGLPLALVLPGYAVTAALSGRSFGLIERTLLTLGLSITLVIMGGLLLNLTPWGLQAGSWAVLLGSISLAACGIALLHRSHENQTQTSQVINPASKGPQLSRWLNKTQFVMLGLAAIVVVSAFAVARNSAEQQNVSFTQLWMLPTAPNSDTVKVGLHNNERASIKYRVALEVDGKAVQEWASIELASGQRWETTAQLPTDNKGRVEAVVYRLDAPQTLYRRVGLAAGK